MRTFRQFEEEVLRLLSTPVVDESDPNRGRRGQEGGRLGRSRYRPQGAAQRQSRCERSGKQDENVTVAGAAGRA